MSKKIIAELSFSPATVAKLGDYATQLRVKRRLYGLGAAIFGVLVVLQLIMLIWPTLPFALDYAALHPIETDGTAPLGFTDRLELLVASLPQVGGWMLTGVYALLALVALGLQGSARLREKELRIIRRQLNAGGPL